MTQEEKAKAYDQSLKKAKIWYSDAQIDFKKSLENLFPVLKESEDERIRKEIIEYIKTGTYHKSWIAWLEKQGNTDGIIERAKTEKQRVIITETDGNANIDWDTRSLEDARKLLECGLQYINTELKKQGKEFPASEKRDFGYFSDPVDKVEPKFKVGDTIVEKDLDECGYGTIKDIKDGQYIFTDGSHINIDEQEGWQLVKTPTNIEQKSANKVEPRFKVGDWVIGRVTENEPRQIAEITEEGYKTTYGGWIGFSFEEDIHLWTIRDAKDGDVLCDYHEAYNNPLIFILKKFEHVNFGLVRPSDYSSYCFLTAGGRQRFKEGTYHHKHNIKPATKEQRDLLFAKMKEGGYTFDFENKELKKGEQKPEENKGNIGGISPNWSEEDEVKINRIVACLENLNVADNNILLKDVEWLKSLKGRVQQK